MKIPAHIAISTVAGLTAYGLTKSETLTGSVFLSSLLIDIDHVPDYILLSKERLSIKNFLSWYNEKKWDRIYIILHSYEIIAILVSIASLFRNDIIIGVAIGCALHLIADQIGNMTFGLGKRLSPWFYFLSYRYCMEFMKNRMLVEG